MKIELLAKIGLTWKTKRREILTFVTAAAMAAPLASAAQSVTLAWNPSPSANIAGYMVYYGNDGTNFGGELDAGTNTVATITGLAPGSTNYIEVVAYDSGNNESPPSNEIEYVVPLVTNTVAVQAAPANAGSVTGGGAFVAGSVVTVTATAGNGYAFVNWTENGIAQSTSSNYSFTLAANRALIANFAANPVNYTVALQSSPAMAEAPRAAVFLPRAAPSP